MWVAGAIAVVALLGAGTWLAYPVLLKRFRPEPTVVTAPVQAPSEPVQPPVVEVGKEPEAPGPGPNVQPPVTAAPPVDRGDGGREAEARRNAERLASERAAAERAAADRAAQERMAAERAASERAAADRLAQERLAREAEEKQQAARRAAAAGPRSGVLTWQGRLVKGEVVTITGTSASTGEVSGVALPGGAVLLQSGSGCTVSSAPVPSSGFKQFSFRCKQAGAVTAEFQWNKP
jgi:type IV secretory pathway VirB10-like protein